jgi:hypothetical protein
VDHGDDNDDDDDDSPPSKEKRKRPSSPTHHPSGPAHSLLDPLVHTPDSELIAEGTAAADSALQETPAKRPKI